MIQLGSYLSGSQTGPANDASFGIARRSWSHRNDLDCPEVWSGLPVGYDLTKLLYHVLSIYVFLFITEYQWFKATIETLCVFDIFMKVLCQTEVLIHWSMLGANGNLPFGERTLELTLAGPLDDRPLELSIVTGMSWHVRNPWRWQLLKRLSGLLWSWSSWRALFSHLWQFA